jgi:hypothetical protein
VAIPVEGRERHIVPRWHRSSVAAARGELVSVRGTMQGPPTAIDLYLLDEKKSDWEENRSLSFATDFVGTALLLDRAEGAKEAATQVLETHDASVALG